MIDVDKYLDDKVTKGYVYFIYSSILNKIYVGETININRIEMYSNIINEKDSYIRFKTYESINKKQNRICEDLLVDIINTNNQFKVFYFKTKYNKHLERSYIRFLSESKYYLYNSMYYKSHKYDKIEIDIEMINSFGLNEHKQRLLYQK